MLDPFSYIDAFLKKPGQSQAKMAERANVRPAYLSDVRQGKHRPKSEVCESIAQQLVEAGILPEEKRGEFLWEYRKHRTGAARLKPRRSKVQAA